MNFWIYEFAVGFSAFSWVAILFALIYSRWDRERNEQETNN